METKEVMLYTVTIISFIAFVYIFFGAVSKIPNISDKKFMSLTGNAVLDLGESFKVGDSIKGNIIINNDETNAYGVLLLTKDDKPLMTKTFNLNEIPKNKIDDGKYSINLDNLIDYRFGERGNYELLFSVLDLDMNIKKEFVVE